MSRLKEGTDDSWRSPEWRETAVEVEVRVLNSGEKTTIMDADLEATCAGEHWASLPPRKVDPGFFGTVGSGNSSFAVWYSVSKPNAPLPLLTPHEPVTLDLAFVIPKRIGGAEVACELRLRDTYQKVWRCRFVAHEEPSKY